MSYTIQSAAFANADHTAAIIQTKEAGAVAISEADRPDLWAAMLAWGTPVDYVAPVISYRDKRAVAYRDRLGSDKGDFIRTMGDTLDVLIRQVRTLAGAGPNDDFAAMVAKIDAIKAEFPKPQD